MTRADDAEGPAHPAGPLLPALWFLTSAGSAAPGLLLLANAERGLPTAAGLALLVAGVVAAGAGATARLGSRTRLLGAGSLVVALCLAAPLCLTVDGRLSAAGWLLFGGVAALLAVLAGALTLRGAGDGSAPSSRFQRTRRAGRLLGGAAGVVVLAILPVVIAGTYTITETYGGGDWLGLAVPAVAVGLLAAVAVLGVTRLADRRLPSSLALAAVGVVTLLMLSAQHFGASAHDRWVAAQRTACDGEVTAATLALGRAIGHLVQQDNGYAIGRDDGRCVVDVTMAAGADVRRAVGDAATRLGWSAQGEAWMSPHGVRVTATVLTEPKSSGLVVELAAQQGG